LGFAEAQTAIVEKFARRLQYLEHPIRGVLDIGAYRGDFARLSKRLFPGATIKCIEADERQKPYLTDFDTLFCLVGNQTGLVDFYTLQYYARPLVFKKECHRLDDLNLDSFDLIKIDVQGAELDVLKGGERYIKQTKPKYLLLETAFQEYNQGAPLASEIISYLYKKKYVLRDIIDLMYDDDTQLLQVDFLFERNA
jgi:hypothetical protein